MCCLSESIKSGCNWASISSTLLGIGTFLFAINNKTAIRPNTRVDSGFLLAFAYKLFTDFCYFLSSCE